ncbi:alpha/beta hydrolase fold domain-containing protein [Ditylenchus destructor]|nr:alpha/beta hydrolase fold domain-containing protein [Ditylenchus destructor]
MVIKQAIFFGLVSVVLCSLYYLFTGSSQTKLVVPEDGYYGTGDKKGDNPTIIPFKINFPDSSLQELKSRLKNSRIGHSQLEDVDNFEYGITLSTLREFQEYWLNHYDWRKYEEKLNSFPQFTTQIEGLKVHFIHAKPPSKAGYKRVIPLLIVHGWPGNVFEFYKIIPMLTDPRTYLQGKGLPDDLAFEVIAPSIPGYGWSEQPRKSGFDQLATARILNKLMVDRLKFKKYVAQGGDWGAFVVTLIGRMFPSRVHGVHLNHIPIVSNGVFSFLHAIVGSVAPQLVFSAPEFADYSLKKLFMGLLQESGYFHIQATKPDTVGVALNDSPIGLMAYILEKFSTWTNPAFTNLADGGLEKKFTKDELLTIITTYWLSGNILSSQRYYKEFARNPLSTALSQRYTTVPHGYAAFPYDFRQPVSKMLCIFGKSVTVSTLFVLINLIIPCQQQKQPPLVPPKPVMTTTAPPIAVVAPVGVNCQGACILGQILCPSARIRCVVPPHCYRLVSNGKELVWQTATGKSVNTLITAAGGKVVQPQLKCEDRADNCHVFKNLCREPLYHVFMASRCSKSCAFCGSSSNGTNPETSKNNGETAVKPIFNLSSPAPLPIRTVKKVEMRRRPPKNWSTTTKNVQTTTQKTTARATATTSLMPTTQTQISGEDLNSENATSETKKTEMTEKSETIAKMTSTTQQSVTEEEEIEMAVATSNEATDDNDQTSTGESQNGTAVAEKSEIAQVEDSVDEISLPSTTPASKRRPKRKCRDESPNCAQFANNCQDAAFVDMMHSFCKKTCNLC